MAEEQVHSNGNMEQRLTRVEATVEQLGQHVNHFVSAQERDRDELFNRIDRLRSDYQASRQTNWPIVIGALGLVMTFLIMSGGLVMLSVRATTGPIEANLSAISPGMASLSAASQNNALDIRQLQTQVGMMIALPNCPKSPP